MDERYLKLAQVPANALKTINYGALKGKSDINPQWRYEALTEVFGLCGVGWRFEVTGTKTANVEETLERMVFVFVNLYVKVDGKWSEPIPGCGGDFLIKKDKNGLHGNDEAYKMATTDALGNAAKMVGVAADVYRGTYNTKYEKRGAAYHTMQADPLVTVEQRASLKALCTATNCPYEKLLAFYKTTEQTMTASTYNRIVAAVKARATKEHSNEETQVANQ